MNASGFSSGLAERPAGETPASVVSARRLSLGHFALVAVVVLAFVVRLVAIVESPTFHPQTDAADYDREAVSLAQDGSFPPSLLTLHGGPSAFRPPLFPVALAVTYKLTGTTGSTARWDAGRIMEALLGTATVLFIGLIARRLWGMRRALLSAALAAIYPPLVLAGSSLMSESLFIPLMLLAVLCSLVARESPRPRSWAVAAGALVGLVALTRSNGIAMILPVCLLLWLVPRRSWRSLQAPAVALAAMIVVLGPWIVRDARLFGQFVPISTESGFALAGTYNAVAQGNRDYPALWIPPVLQQQQIQLHSPDLNEAQISDRLDTAGLDYLRAHPTALLTTGFWNVLRLFNLTGTRVEQFAARFEAYPRWLTDVSVYAFWALLVALLAGLLGRTARGAPWAVWIFPALVLISGLPFSGTTRYRVPADPFLIMIAAGALAAAAGRVRGRERGRDPRARSLRSAAS